MKLNRFVAVRFSGLAIALLLASTATGSKALAIEFELKKGEQYELCRDMATNLRAFPDLLPQPFDLPFDPVLTDFHWVAWEPLEPLDHVEVLRLATIYRNDFAGRKSPEEREAFWQREKPALLEKAQAGAVYLERASFDANHDGKREVVYRLSQDIYQWPATYPSQGRVSAWNLFIMPQDDPKASRHLLRYSKRPLNPFYYKGRIFYWNATWPLVYEPVEGREGEDFVLVDVCVFSPLNK